MMRREIKDFYEENKSYTISFIILAILCIAGVWLVHDYTRNEPVYNNTDESVEQLEKRIQSVEHRLDGMSKRIEQNQKTVESVGRRISTSTGLAIEITEGTGRAEERLNSAIDRSERIQAIIADIERKNQ